MESDDINLDIVYDGTAPPLWNLQVGIVASGPGTLDMTSLTEPSGAWDPFGTIIIENTAGKDYSLAYTAGTAGTGILGAGIALDHILLHCDDADQVILTMSDWNYMGMVSMDGMGPLTGFGAPVVVNQIPEPMTIALLGLGSLFLLRRRK